MATEIERKFLLKSDEWRSLASGSVYCQGYIAAGQGKTVRVRIIDNRGYLTVKGRSSGISRLEFEYEIPVEDAKEMLDNLCDRPFIEKIRYKIPVDGFIWEVDEFFGENQGLILAEVELTDEHQEVKCPNWIGQEVSGDWRYSNSSLVKYPFTRWTTRS
ncbi:MAG: CYTH domain-containing protein [Geitlerinemataceae cyanobacterium]